MSLRLRLIVAAATAVAVAVVLFAFGGYFITRHELRHQVDASLERRLGVRFRVANRPLPVPPGFDAGARVPGQVATLQVISSDGAVVRSNGTPLPVTASDRALAAGAKGERYREQTTDGTHLRVATEGIGNGLAIVAAAPLDAVDATLHRLVLLLALAALGGVALAAALGTVVARAALAPVERLTASAERVASSRDLTSTIEVHGADEVARLGSAMNAMLMALDESQRAQRRLVADASHELRTPLTSLRTNLEVLARSHAMPAEERQALLADLIAQVTELGALVSHLVDLEHTGGGGEPIGPVALDEVVDGAVARLRRRDPRLVVTSDVEPTTVLGRAATLDRAVANLLDNAAKWSPPGGAVEVSLSGGLVQVADSGPGIDPADLPYVFDRFYRSVSARGLPGSGLGLSIVQEAAEEHGGRVWMQGRPGGGTIACFQVPVEPRPGAGVETPPVIHQGVGRLGT